jgi:hypothetical protein
VQTTDFSSLNPEFTFLVGLLLQVYLSGKYRTSSHADGHIDGSMPGEYPEILRYYV